MTTLLILTAGQTDVQLVVDGVRCELSKNCCGELHDELEKREFTIIDAPTRKEKSPRDALPEGGLTVCTPKLDAVLRSFDSELPIAAIVFETRRTLKSDPRLAGTVLERRLTERGIRVRRHSFLEGDTWLEDPSSDVDAVVRRSIIEGFSNLIASEVGEMKPERIIVATTGGLPPANDVIEELVRLHAVGRAQVIALEVPDRVLGTQNDRAIPEKFHPAAGYRARWQALSLIERGNLLGAWGAVSHLEDAPGQDWTQVIKWLAHFASSLPLPEACDYAVLRHERMAVRAALRVELALRAGDIPRAVHGTVAFFEAALWDHLGKKTSRHATKRQFKFHESPPPELIREDNTSKLAELSKTKQDENRKRPFIFKETANDADWYWIDDTKVCAIQLAKHYLRCEGLTKLAQTASDDVRNLRNDAAHQEPSPLLMEGARLCMQTVSLWSISDTFLSQSLVQDVLKELGEAEPRTLLENLLADVRRRLLTPDSTRGTL
jgi:hypothetical protein